MSDTWRLLLPLQPAICCFTSYAGQYGPLLKVLQSKKTHRGFPLPNVINHSQKNYAMKLSGRFTALFTNTYLEGEPARPSHRRLSSVKLGYNAGGKASKYRYTTPADCIIMGHKQRTL